MRAESPPRLLPQRPAPCLPRPPVEPGSRRGPELLPGHAVDSWATYNAVCVCVCVAHVARTHHTRTFSPLSLSFLR